MGRDSQAAALSACVLYCKRSGYYRCFQIPVLSEGSKRLPRTLHHGDDLHGQLLLHTFGGRAAGFS